ncbi:hypothetical protein LZ554_001957 [Drepanopeziza brunnea f. sp. 'monogermtubi']|nr:hypothetical protein LZ554_001957 [Drepanopeziza brunnea f. sp. 'monogermtubi']
MREASPEGPVIRPPGQRDKTLVSLIIEVDGLLEEAGATVMQLSTYQYQSPGTGIRIRISISAVAWSGVEWSGRADDCAEEDADQRICSVGIVMSITLLQPWEGAGQHGKCGECGEYGKYGRSRVMVDNVNKVNNVNNPQPNPPACIGLWG